MRGLFLTAFAIALALPIGVRAQTAPNSAHASRSYYTEAQAAAASSSTRNIARSATWRT